MSWEIEIQANLDDVLGVLDRETLQARAHAGIGDITSPVVDVIPLGLEGPMIQRRHRQRCLPPETYQPTHLRLVEAHAAFEAAGACMSGGKVVVRFYVAEVTNGRAGLAVKQIRTRHEPQSQCEISVPTVSGFEA